jgi:response regulator RpfG family c-di-GMP phosphodiesterase
MRSTIQRAEQFSSEVFVAKDGKEALTELGKREFDLVLSDYKMPEMSGVELLAKVKSKYPKTVRMLITGYSDAKIAKDAINKAQVHNYIEKPWDNGELRLTVYEALKRKSEREAERLTTVDSTDNAKESLIMLKEFQHSIFNPREIVPKQKMVFEFTFPTEFNRFSFEVKKMKNVFIEDVHIFENKYILSLVVSPTSYGRIK